MLYYGTIFENFEVDSDSATSGTVRVGDGNVRFPKGSSLYDDQTPSNPCPTDQTGIKYEYEKDTDEFVQPE